MMTEGMKMFLKKYDIIISDDEKYAELDQITYRVKSINESDHEGHCWLWMEFEDGQEFISYDDGESWVEPDTYGYW